MSTFDRLDDHRPELFGHCYRMLGSVADAEDAVQDTLLKAWRSESTFDGRSALATWLYRIATNVCIDRLRSGMRRGLPTSSGRAGTVDDPLEALPERHWLEPVPEAMAVPEAASPERRAELRQSLRLAFVAALQSLPPRQRAALLLKDVLGFSTEEIATTLETSAASVNSALQRARASLAEGEPGEHRATESQLSPPQRELLERYVDAFHAYDVDALVALLADDVKMSMPPYTLWLEGRESVKGWFLGRGISCKGSRLVPVPSSGDRVFAQYHHADGSHHAWALIVLELIQDRIGAMTFFLDVERLFPAFGLPLELRG